ncbi:MAG: aminomethyl-transferring glycine dehydrogenase subunit GcvPB [Acetobacteraceae bacterium]|nr:aminomethyl-transferring glycine dehydrogenase subunit GcvPB [Acetobacteraceae bacterium]
MTGPARGPEPLIFELSSPGRTAFSLPELDVPERKLQEMLPASALREAAPGLPEVSEVDLVRHFVRLSRLNYGVDLGIYPLGSCTMKYSPKINEDLARLPGFTELHPYQPEDTVQGALELMYLTQRFLCEIGGVDAVSLQPAAGAHGELTGLMLIKAYHTSRGDTRRNKIIIPDSSHGTNPASAVVCGMQTVQVRSDRRGGVDLDALREVLDDQVSALMLTNPNTLGLFDENIHRIAEMVHQAGGMLYYDGANANAILGIARPGDAGFDVVHFNLHKTFSTPHGGGGPGSGPVGVKKALEPFLPVPIVGFDGARYYLDYDRPRSIGRVRSFYGNFGVVLKAYAYIRSMGPEGLLQVSKDAVLNANYLMRRLQPYFDLPYDRHCKHEFVLSGRRQKAESGVKTLDISKRLLDYGVHPPTNYFPLIVEECLMVEPTESESRETLDAFADALIQIAREAKDQPDLVKSAPHVTPVGRLDEVLAARQPNLRWRPPAPGGS